MWKKFITIAFSRVILHWMLCLCECSAGTLGGLEWQELTGTMCGRSRVLVTCPTGQWIVLDTIVYNISCVSASSLQCGDCSETIKDATSEHAACNMNHTCYIPQFDCRSCFIITTRLQYACVPERVFYPMCADRNQIQNVPWGLLYSDMFPAYISTKGCLLVLKVPPGWRAVVRPIFLDLRYPVRLDVCSGTGEHFRCFIPGEVEHDGDVTIHLADAARADDKRFLLEFSIYRKPVSTTPVIHKGDLTTRANADVTITVVTKTISNNTSNTSQTISVPNTFPTNRPTAPKSGWSSLTSQEYLMIGLGILLAIVLFSAVTICVVVYRRKNDSALKRVIVVLIREPTKRLSRLSRLFRLSDVEQQNPRYSNPPEENSEMRNRQNITVHPVMVNESARTLLAKLNDLGVQVDVVTPRSERPSHQPGVASVPLRHQRSLRTSELVIETPPQEEQTHKYANPPSFGQLHIGPTPSISKDVQRLHSDEPIYEEVARPAPPSRRPPGIQMAPLDNSAREGTPGGSYESTGFFTDDELTIVENDSYGDV